MLTRSTTCKCATISGKNLLAREELMIRIMMIITVDHNPNSLVLGVAQISESFGLVNVYIFNGAYSIFYLMHHKVLMKITRCGVRIKGIWIIEGLYNELLLLCSGCFIIVVVIVVVIVVINREKKR